ncbi:hypothetical protein [Terrabacter terrigena]|uniref:DUF3168 domain-containing protein n=1 Tax=Terrabacter terrigena TaxID=574718 RepID=A0ABW3MXW5_9MICO
MAVAWHKVRAKLAASLPGIIGPGTTFGVSIFDGPVVTGENPPAAFTIAYAPSLAEPTVGRFTQEQGPDGYTATETGALVCELAMATGYTTVPDVFGAFDAIASWIQADQTLGGTLSPASTCTAAADVVQAQSSSGAVQRLIVTISYRTNL